MEDKHIAIYGGAFDPPHVGHVLSVMWILSTQDVDRIWILPAYNHPSGKEMAPFAHRMNMCREAFNVFEGASVREEEKQAGGEGYTLNLLKYLKEKYPEEYKFSLIIGADNYLDRRSWRKWEEVEALIEDYIVLGRVGSPVEGTLQICDISSTDVRNAFNTEPFLGANNIPLASAVPRRVFQYIYYYGLYNV